MARRDLCESAKKGKLCIDDLCHGSDVTLCGFYLDEYEEMLDETWNDLGLELERMGEEEPGW
jgi:hypothetical protein